jgi:predicted PurR-regulated permease PerM
MTVLFSSPPVAQSSPPQISPRVLDTLATLLVVCLTVTILYVAREILVPIAIAILFSFVLSPPIKLLRRWGFPKPLAVGVVVFMAVCTILGIGALLTKQIADLAGEAPRYQSIIKQKVDFAQNFLANNPLITKIDRIASDFKTPNQAAPANQAKKPAPAALSTNMPQKSAQRRSESAPGEAARNESSRNEPARADATKPLPVQIVSPPPDALALLETFGGAAASPVLTGAFVALFVVFMLMQREDLRNRFIRLVGSGDLNLTTMAMNEAASRLSRYFLAQVLLNTAFGVAVAIALTLIGTPSAILWGVVATCMRFVPYLGTIGAAFFPVLMGAAADHGWSMAIETAVFFVAIELVTGQVVEPLLYGRHTGISPLAVVVSATFWAWLWGPVGLLLSTPLTVCLAVMGRHVERLSFLYVLLGDAPPLSPAQSFYQRMLVGDPSEIVEHAETFLRDNTLLAYCDEVAMNALLMAQLDVRRGTLEPERQLLICRAMQDIVDDLAEIDNSVKSTADKSHKTAVAAPVADEDPTADTSVIGPPDYPLDPAWTREHAVVCVAGRTALDEAAAHLLADLLKQNGIGADVEPATSLISNKLRHLASPRPELVILSFLDADLSVAQARFAVRRLRRNIPDTPIVAAFWMPEADEARTAGLCADVRCETCVSQLPQAIALCLERAKARTPEAAAA